MRLFGLLCPAGGYSAGWALCLMFIFAEFLVVLLIFSTCGTAGGFWGLLGSLGSLIGVFFGRISGVVLFFLVVPGVLPDRFFCLAPCSLARAIFRRFFFVWRPAVWRVRFFVAEARGGVWICSAGWAL